VKAKNSRFKGSQSDVWSSATTFFRQRRTWIGMCRTL